MKKQDYHRSFTVSVTPQAAFEKISRASQWWVKDFEGKSDGPNDVFTVRFTSGDMYKIKVSEIILYKKIVWEVIDSYQGWHDNHTEWVGTKIVWEISPEKNGSKVTMTHQGLIPTFECYEKCKMGWDYLMQNSLSKFLTEDIGLPA
jgi:Activator of Hsp90 ATPase homolog 1-like protein